MYATVHSNTNRKTDFSFFEEYVYACIKLGSKYPSLLRRYMYLLLMLFLKFIKLSLSLFLRYKSNA